MKTCELEHPYNFHNWLFSRRLAVYETWHFMSIWNDRYKYHYKVPNGKINSVRITVTEL